MTRPSRRYSGGTVSAQLRAELDRLLQEILAAGETRERSGWTPALDVIDTGKSLVVVVEAAGLAPDDLQIEVEGTTVRIAGRRQLSFNVPGRVRFHCLERQEGRFVRQVEVREPVDFHAAHATLADGLLRLELPKVEERRKRRQTIAVTEIAAAADHATATTRPTAEPPEPST